MLRLHKAFGHIMFKSNNHTYSSGNKSYTSVTTKIGQYQQPFDTKYWTLYKAVEANGLKVYRNMSISKLKAMYKSIKNPKYTPAYFKLKWEKEAKKGQDRGSLVHLVSEQRLYNKESLEDFNFDLDIKNLAVKAINQACRFVENNKNLIPVKTELIVGDEKAKVAGQCDALLYDISSGEYVLLDWKTDKKLLKTNPFQSFKPPLNHLDDCEYNKYSLQLSMYKYFLEENADIEIAKSIIVHVNEDNKDYTIHTLPYLKKEIKEILYGNNKRRNLYTANFN